MLNRQIWSSTVEEKLHIYRAMTIPYMKNCINREFLIKLFAS